jgi:hypothetical protein
LHYPRDLLTAVQSRLGYKKFVKRFPACVRENFPSYYAVGIKESKVTPEQFEDFAGTARIKIKKIPKLEHTDLCNTELIQTLYQCDEGVIDVPILRATLIDELNKSTVELYLNHEITKVIKQGENNFEVISKSGTLESYQIIIRATYGSDQIIFAETDRMYEYHKTLVLSVSSNMPAFGFTVMDGDFITLLPHGFSRNFLIYAPSISTVKKFVGEHPPSNWLKGETKESLMDDNAVAKLMRRTIQYFPNLSGIKVLEELRTVRSIMPNVALTDRRTSNITVPTPGFYEIWSGKIEHSVEVAEKISRHLQVHLI